MPMHFDYALPCPHNDANKAMSSMVMSEAEGRGHCHSCQLTLHILQDDIVHEDLTVRENLEYSAWLRNPKYMRTRAKGDLVDDVIDVLNLRSVQHSVVGTAEKRGIRYACLFTIQLDC